MRAAHVGLTGILAGFGLLAMFGTALAYHLFVGISTAQVVTAVRAIEDGIGDPETREMWATDPDIKDYLVPGRLPETRRRLAEYVATLNREVEGTQRVFTRPERFIFDRAVRASAADSDKVRHTPQAVRQLLAHAQRPERRAKTVNDLRRTMAMFTVTAVALFTASYVISALVFRGGLSFVLAGLTIVRADGRPAGRLWYAAREVLAWLPVVAMVLALIGVQYFWPYWGFGRAFFAFASVATLVGSAAVAIRFPERGPLDRIVGTYVVPV
jgi:hypothetical protein